MIDVLSAGILTSHLKGIRFFFSVMFSLFLYLQETALNPSSTKYDVGKSKYILTMFHSAGKIVRNSCVIESAQENFC